jgi:rhodanese-related sulfurtransferase
MNRSNAISAGDPAEFKRNVYARLAAAGSALSDPTRIAMLDLICQGPKSVETVAEQCGSRMALASHHLRLLKTAGLARDRRDGRRVFYEATTFGEELWGSLARSGQEHIEEIRALLRSFFEASDQGAPEPVTIRELLKRVESGDVTLIDVRPADEFEAGHLPGAVSVPLAELEKRLKEIPRQRQVIAYCRGPYCVLSRQAVILMKKRGIRAVRLADGVMDGRRAGVSIEAGPQNASRAAAARTARPKTRRRSL